MTAHRTRHVLAGLGALALVLSSACSSDTAQLASEQGAEPTGSASGGASAQDERAGATLRPQKSQDEEEGGSAGSGRRSGSAGSVRGEEPEVVDGEIVDSGPDGAGMPTVGPEKRQDDVLRGVDGSAKQACVDVDGLRDVRSGGFAAGPFDTAREEFRDKYGEKRSVRLYLVPAHAAKMPGVVVQAVERDSGARVRLRQDDVADAEEFRFYDVVVDLPSGGTWELRATAGPDRGCWVVELA